MLSKKQRKKILKWILFPAISLIVFFVISNFTIVDLYNCGVITSFFSDAYKKTRMYSTNFDYSHVTLKSVFPSVISVFNGINTSRLVGYGVNNSGPKFASIIKIASNSTQVVFDGLTTSSPWEYMWTNYNVYAPANSYVNGMMLGNNFSAIQVNSKTGATLQQYNATGLRFARKVAHNTWFAQTEEYVLSGIPNNFTLDANNPIFVTFTKTTTTPSGAYNQTNEMKMQFAYNNNRTTERYWYEGVDFQANGLYGLQIYDNGSGGTTDWSGGTRYKSRLYLSLVMATDKSSTDNHVSMYMPTGATTYNFANIESSIMPQNNRNNEIATLWLQDLINKKTALSNFTVSNGIPDTYYGITGSATADNLKGEITITLNTGALIDFRVNDNKPTPGTATWHGPYNQYLPRKSESVTFKYTGFKKVTPTALLSSIDVNNPYIQPQYVSYSDIKKIILENGISGDLPPGFTEDNIVFSSLSRYNDEGSIVVNAYLTLYYDKNGDIVTNNFTPVKITIKGFATTQPSSLPSSIYIDNASNVLASDISAENIKKIIYKYIVDNKMIWVPGQKNSNARFPPNFSLDDLIINNSRIIYDNGLGTIRVDIVCKNYYDDNGEVSNYPSNIGRVTLRNFRAVTPTSLAKDSYDYEDSSNSIFPTDLLSNLYLLKSFISNQIPAYMKPSNFVDERDIVLTDVIADNVSGTINCNVTLNNYFDSQCLPRQTGFNPKNITINFSRSISATYIPSEINLLNTHKDVLPTDLNEEQIKQLIVDNMIRGKPDGYDTSYIKFDTEPVWNNGTGRITVEPILNYWVDNNGVFRHDSKKFGQVVFYNMKGSRTTSFNEEKLLSAGDESWIPTSYIKHYDLLKTLIFKNTNNKPKDFSVENIIINNVSADNTQGLVYANITLNYYNDDSGNPQTKGYQPVDLVIGGFGTNNMPTRINTYILGDNARYAQHYTNNEIKKIVIDNTDNPVEGYSAENIELRNLNYDYLNGIISFVPVLNLWYGDDLSIHNEYKEFDKVTISGLKTTLQTIINTNNLNVGNSDSFASEVAENYHDVLTLVDNTILIGRPDDFDPNNDIVLSNITADDKAGTITVTVILSNYFDSNGLLRNDSFQEQTITFTGYKKVLGATHIDNLIELQGFENKYPFEITTNEVKQLIFDFLVNKIPNMTIHDVTLYNSFVADNIGGKITTTPYLLRYYNDDAQIINEPIKLDSITFSGFKKAPGATSLKSNTLSTTDNILPSEAIKDITKLKEVAYNNLINPTPNLNYNTQIELENLLYDNIVGTVTFDVIVKEVFDSNGEIVSGIFNLGNVTINNYKKSKGLTAIPSRIETTTPNKYASDINKQEIREIIFNSVKNAPEQLNIDGVHIKPESLVVDNKLGIIKLIPILDWTNNVYGEVINVQKEFSEVTIYGYLNASKTTITSTTISALNYPSITNMYPNELANSLSDIKTLAKGLVSNPPPNFNNDNIQIDNIRYDNYTGSLYFDIQLNYYFDDDGIIQYTNFLPVTITVLDLQKTPGVTSVLKIINGNNISKLPSDVTDDEIKEIIFNNTSSLPDGLTKNDISFKVSPNRNNLNGTISVIPVFSRSYNESSDLINVPTVFDEVTITNLKFSSPTSIKSTSLELSTLNLLPSQLAQDVDQIKQIIYKEINNVPNGFSVDNIIINANDIIYDNLSGQLYVGYTLNNYYDANGYIKNSGFEEQWITISKLISTSKTQLVSNEVVINSVSDILPSTYDDTNVKDYIKANYVDIFLPLPNDFTPDTDMVVNIKNKDNINGKIDIEILLYKYYDDAGSLIQTTDINTALKLNFSLTGFNSVSPTKIKDEYTLTNQYNNLPQDIAENTSQVIDVIVSNIYDLVDFLPPIFTAADLLINDSSIKGYNNLDGSITVEIGLKKYWDNNGNLVDVNNDKQSDILRKSIVLKGFKSSLKTTIVNQFNVSNYRNVEAKNIDESILNSIIINNSNFIFSRLPNNNSVDTNLEINILTYDNSKGTVTANVSIYEYYNAEGILITRLDNTPLTKQVVFSGFKTIAQTSINNNIYLHNQSSNLASEMSSDDLKRILNSQQVSDLINHAPSDFNVNENMDIEIILTDNISGEITIEVSLNYYYNNQGILVENASQNDTLTKVVVVSGFKKVKATSIYDRTQVSGYNTINPSTITNETLKEIIIDNKDVFFVNLPYEFKESDLSVNILSSSQAAGSIFASITLNTFYDENEELVTTRQLTSEITIYGFQRIFSPNSSSDTLIIIASVAAVMTVAFVGILAVTFIINKRRVKL